MVEFNVEGIKVEVDGVEREELPNAFDFGEVWEMAQSGKSIGEMEEYLHTQRWIESHRGSIFWNEWTQES